MDAVRIEEIKRRITVRELAEEAGVEFRKDAARCILHGGDSPTAFHLRDGDTHWHCFTRCPAGQNDGDVITFYQRLHHVSFVEAVQALGQRVGVAPEQTKPVKSTPSAMTPGATWQARGAAFCRYAQEQLLGNPALLADLQARRGLTAETAQVWGLGWNPRAWRLPAAEWGLTGDPVYLHPGVVIPHWFSAELWGIKIRVYENGQPVTEKGGKYRGPRDGRTQGMLYGAAMLRSFPVLVLCEGEFDALLAWQSSGEFCDVAAVSGAQAKAHQTTLLLLARYASILVVMDDDQAGNEARAYWRKLPRVQIVPPPDHDLTDYWQHGGNLRQWLAQQVATALYTVLDRVQLQQPERFQQWLTIYNAATGAANA